MRQGQLTCARMDMTASNDVSLQQRSKDMCKRAYDSGRETCLCCRGRETCARVWSTVVARRGGADWTWSLLVLLGSDVLLRADCLSPDPYRRQITKNDFVTFQSTVEEGGGNSQFLTPDPTCVSVTLTWALKTSLFCEKRTPYTSGRVMSSHVGWGGVEWTDSSFCSTLGVCV
jgi:hypothetical protein